MEAEGQEDQSCGHLVSVVKEAVEKQDWHQRHVEAAPDAEEVTVTLLVPMEVGGDSVEQYQVNAGHHQVDRSQVSDCKKNDFDKICMGINNFIFLLRLPIYAKSSNNSSKIE